jgi:hypothetical protein
VLQAFFKVSRPRHRQTQEVEPFRQVAPPQTWPPTLHLRLQVAAVVLVLLLHLLPITTVETVEVKPA